MNRDEIEELKGLAASMGLYDDKNPCKRAVILGKAIEELEQQTCEDAISRQAVKEQMIKYGFHAPDMTVTEFVEGLPPVNPQPCPDSISRSDMFDAIGHGTIYTSEDLQRIIKTLPPVNPQPKTGHWISLGIQGEADGQIVQVFTCSECGAISIFRMANGNIVNGDICPNCSVKMTESQESEVRDEDRN